MYVCIYNCVAYIISFTVGQVQLTYFKKFCKWARVQNNSKSHQLELSNHVSIKKAMILMKKKGYKTLICKLGITSLKILAGDAYSHLMDSFHQWNNGPIFLALIFVQIIVRSNSFSIVTFLNNYCNESNSIEWRLRQNGDVSYFVF